MMLYRPRLMKALRYGSLAVVLSLKYLSILSFVNLKMNVNKLEYISPETNIMIFKA